MSKVVGNSGHDTTKLGAKAASGAAFLGAAQVVKVATTLLSVVITSRLLSPDQFGVVAMATPITGFILLFQSLGLNQAVIQSQQLTTTQSNSLFWISLAASLVISIVFLAISPFVSWFYGDVRPGWIVAASSLTVIVSGMSLQHMALLNRDLKFRQISIVNAVGSITSLLVMVGIALAYSSFWAIWAGGLASVAAMSALAWRYSRWRPSFRISFVGVNKLISFGANVTAFNFLNFFARNFDRVLIARYWGTSEVGLYDRSYQLMMFPVQSINTPLSQLMLPLLSRLSSSSDRYRSAFLMSVRAIALVSIPGILACAICSSELVPLLLGSGWQNAEPIFFWLSMAAVLQPISNATGWLFISSGRAKAMMHWGLFSTPLTIGSFVAGLPWGATGVAAAYFLGQAVRVPLLYYWCTRGTSVRPSDLYRASAPTLLGGAATYMISFPAREHLADFALICLVFALSYVCSIGFQCLTKEGRATIFRMANLAAGLLRPERRKIDVPQK